MYVSYRSLNHIDLSVPIVILVLSVFVCLTSYIDDYVHNQEDCYKPHTSLRDYKRRFQNSYE